MPKKPPKQGEQIVGDLTETVVTDPDPVPETELDDAAVAAELVKILGSAPSEAPAPVPTWAPSLLLEDGGRVPIDHQNDPPGFRVVGLNGFVYDHCADTSTGEWIYRKQ